MDGYILAAGTVLYIAGSLRYSQINNIQEFQAAFSTRYCSVSNCITLGGTIESETVHVQDLMDVHCRICWKARWITSVSSEEISAILPCKALYLQPEISHALFIQYSSVSSCFFMSFDSKSHCILQGETEFKVRLHCTECTMNYKCFIRRYRCDPAMYGNLQPAKI